MNPTVIAALTSAIYLGWSKLCENAGVKEPIAWTLVKTGEGRAFVGQKAAKAGINLATAAAAKLQENMAKAKTETPDIIDVKAAEPKAEEN